MKWDIFINSFLGKHQDVFTSFYVWRVQVVTLIWCFCLDVLLLYALDQTAFVVCLIVYPVWCNLSEYLRNKLLVVERRVFRNLGCVVDPSSVFLVGDKMCRKLYENVVLQPDHPLHCFFTERHARKLRSNSVLARSKTKTKRFFNSFIKFCSWILLCIFSLVNFTLYFICSSFCDVLTALWGN